MRPNRPIGRRDTLDPNLAQAAFVEPERHADGTLRDVLTVLTTGQECRFACTFCDLWQNTLPFPTPPGAIVRQLDAVLAHFGTQAATIKLYNASNWFDATAVPRGDWPAIAARLNEFSRVVVESHPRLCTDVASRFADRLSGQLEVAVGLETANADLLARLNKQMTLDDFATACERLLRWGIDVRTFVLAPPPFVAEADQEPGSLAEAAGWAMDCGASVVTLLPLRPRQVPGSSRPTPQLIEAAIREASPRLSGGRRLFVDLWDARQWCDEATAVRLDRWNRTQQVKALQTSLQSNRTNRVQPTDVDELKEMPS